MTNMRNIQENTIQASEYAISLLMDSSTPLILEIQLMWFDQRITDYIKKELFYEVSNGIRIGYNSEFSFTYTPPGMEPKKGYLLGFGSNKAGTSYNKAKIHCQSEEEKFQLAKDISIAIHDLIQVAIPLNKTSSPWFVWNLR